MEILSPERIRIQWLYCTRSGLKIDKASFQFEGGAGQRTVPSAATTRMLGNDLYQPALILTCFMAPGDRPVWSATPRTNRTCPMVNFSPVKQVNTRAVGIAGVAPFSWAVMDLGEPETAGPHSTIRSVAACRGSRTQYRRIAEGMPDSRRRVAPPPASSSFTPPVNIAWSATGPASSGRHSSTTGRDTSRHDHPQEMSITVR